MKKKTLGIITSEKELTDKELEQNKKLKPHLRKFVIDLQRKRAEETSKAKKLEDDAMLGADDIIKRASELASKALLRDKIWQKSPPTLEMKWTNSAEYQATEVQTDIAGFATYLIREYRNYLREIGGKNGYPHPMVEKNLPFFWEKFNADLRLLIEAERRRVAKGNKSNIITMANPTPQPQIITDTKLVN